MELLEDLYAVDGWERLSEHQKNVLFVVFQDHQGARLANMVRAAGDPENPNLVYVHFRTEWYHYGIDTKTGRSIWY